MKAILSVFVLVLCALAVSCAQIKTDGVAKTTTSTFFACDFKNFAVSPIGASIGEFNGTKVPMSAIRTAGTVGTAAIVNGMLQTVHGQDTAVSLGAQKAATEQVALKEATKQAANAGSTAVKLATIPK